MTHSVYGYYRYHRSTRQPITQQSVSECMLPFHTHNIVQVCIYEAYDYLSAAAALTEARLRS